MDVLTKKQRSYCMSQIKGRDTSHEIQFRKLLWNNGLRGYRVHKLGIEGKPDIYFPKKRIAIFIDGCFWHKCPNCFVKPKSNMAFWEKKIGQNVQRDRKVNATLKGENIRILRFWEHEIRSDPNKALKSIMKALCI